MTNTQKLALAALIVSTAACLILFDEELQHKLADDEEANAHYNEVNSTKEIV